MAKFNVLDRHHPQYIVCTLRGVSRMCRSGLVIDNIAKTTISRITELGTKQKVMNA
jgi:hypothetical protein